MLCAGLASVKLKSSSTFGANGVRCHGTGPLSPFSITFLQGVGVGEQTAFGVEG